MVRKLEETVVCDVCGRDKARKWTIIASDGDRTHVDLCHHDSAYLRDLQKKGMKARKGPFGLAAIKVQPE